MKNSVALIFSLWFYTWGAPKFIFVVLLGLILDFYFVQLIEVSEGKKRRRILSLAIWSNVLILLVSKYLNFFVDNVNEVLSAVKIGGIEFASIALPIGISFITFQKISYIVDVHSGKSKALKSFADYALYILLFPQLIAGPIVRYKEIAAQLRDRSANDHIDMKLTGLHRFTIGLSKKMLIANPLGEMVDLIFAVPPGDMGSMILWIGIVAYSFQIYFDFSGYSDMAIGIANMLGFKFPENFNLPYISQSITEFWRRWHMTLGNWMRDYLYIPLGGNRVSITRMYINLCAVFLISGFWHGAAWTFIFWGAFHGFFLVLERLFLLDVFKKIGKFPSIVIIYVLVLISWVFFRSPDMSFAFSYIKNMFIWDSAPHFIYLNNKFWIALIIGAIFAFTGMFKVMEQQFSKWFEIEKNNFMLTFKTLSLTFLGLLSIAEIFGSDFNPFIYFQF